MLVEAVFAGGSGPAKVHVRGEASEDLTQEKLDALCASGQIGDMLEAESVPVMDKLQRLIAQERELEFILIGGSDTTGACEPAQAAPTPEAEPEGGGEASWVTTTFHAGACAMCLQQPGDKKLQRCTACKHVYLCGQECLKKYWPRHKLLCKALSKAAQEEASLAADAQLGSHGALGDFVEGKARSVAKRLKGRALDVYETDLLWNQKVCEVCWRVNASDSLLACQECQSCWYCPEHEEEFKRSHCLPLFSSSSSSSSSAPPSRYMTSRCAALKNNLEVNQVLLECGGSAFWMPPSSASFHGTPSPAAAAPVESHGDGESSAGQGSSDWEGWLNARDCPGFVTGFLLPVTLELSFPLSVAHALSLFNLVPAPSLPPSPPPPLAPAGDGLKLTVHVIGAEPGPELTNAIKYEEVLHSFPSLSSLHMVFVGPSLAFLPDSLLSSPSSLNLCDGCKGGKRSCTIQRVPQLYQDWQSTSGSASGVPGWTRPDLVLAFNSRCWDLGSGDTPAPDTWGPALDFVLAQEIPCLFTGAGPEDVQYDAELLEGMGAQIVLPAQENPWASLWWRPVRSALTFEAQNQSFFGVKGRVQPQAPGS